MLTISNVITPSAEQWLGVVRGMRNPMNSWGRMDSKIIDGEFILGENDRKLMLGLAGGGPVHAKYRRMLHVTCDISAPLYWWKEFDTYRVGVAPNPTDIEMNSCSTMHKIHAKEFTLDDFSHEHLLGEGLIPDHAYQNPYDILCLTIESLNHYRKLYLEITDAINTSSWDADMAQAAKTYWWQMIQLLPSSYNQTRTIDVNYEALAGMYFWRNGHKLDEWRHELCPWISTLPNSEIIMDRKNNPLKE